MSLAKPMPQYRQLSFPGPLEPQGIDFRRLWDTLLRRIHVILAFAVIGALLGFALQSVMPRRYTSSVAILLDPKRADSVGAEGQFASMAVDVTKIASVLAVLESSYILGRVVQTEKLADDPMFSAPGKSFSERLSGYLPFLSTLLPSALSRTPEDRALDWLTRAVRVNRVGPTYVLTVDVSASRPQTAQRLARAVADAYLNDQVETKDLATRRDSLWLADRVSELRRQLAESEEAVESIRQKYGLLETQTDHGPGPSLERRAITELNDQLIQAQGETASRRARYEQVERIRKAGGNLETLPEAAGSGLIGLLREKQADAIRQVDSLRSVYSENFPELQHAKNTLHALDVQIAAELSRIVERIRSDYETALARERALSEQVSRATTADAGASSVEGRLQLREAQRTADARRGLYESIVSRWREVEQQQTRHEPEARIISQADLPTSPSSPKPLIFPAGGVALGLLSSLGLTLLLPKLERGFVSAVDLEKRLGLPVFGAVPMLGMQELAVARRKPSIIDYIVKNPLSRFAESLRDIRTALHIADHSGPRIIQVMSAVPGEGKSTIAAALAISAARAGLRTVLVDADLRYPSVSAMFDLRGKEGLVDILIKGIPLQSALQADREIPLAIVAAGSAVSPQPDIIATQQFSGLLLDLANHYDFVVLDSPPILAVSDALAISRHVDATLLVIEWRTTPKDLVEQAVKLLRTLRAPIAGVAFNKINLLNFDQNQNRDLKYRISIDKYCGAASPEVISGALSSNKPRPPRERPNDTN